MHTLSDFVLHGTNRRHALVRDGLLVLAASMLVAVCAKVQVPGPIPMTLQTFAVVLVGAMLGSKHGAAAILAYLLEGAAGLPVFAGPVAGPAYFAGPTAGYLLGFVVAAWVVGKLAEHGWDRRFFAALGVFALGHVLVLALGFAWLAAQAGAQAAFITGVWVFLPGAAVKTLLAAVALPVAWKRVRSLDRSDDVAWFHRPS